MKSKIHINTVTLLIGCEGHEIYEIVAIKSWRNGHESLIWKVGVYFSKQKRSLSVCSAVYICDNQGQYWLLTGFVDKFGRAGSTFSEHVNKSTLQTNGHQRAEYQIILHNLDHQKLTTHLRRHECTWKAWGHFFGLKESQSYKPQMQTCKCLIWIVRTKKNNQVLIYYLQLNTRGLFRVVTGHYLRRTVGITKF